MSAGMRFTEVFSRDRRLQNLVLCALILVVGVVLTLLSERIPVAHGLGFDGEEYGNWAMHFDKVLSREIPVSPYRMFRILPSALAYATLRLTGVTLATENIIHFFQVFNLALLGLAALSWGGVADAAGLNLRGKLLGFIGLFGNHAILKYNFYYPVLTDTSAYTLALLSLYAYLRDKRVMLFVATVAGTFCWPTLIVHGSILLLFPRKDHTPEGGKEWMRSLPAVLAAGTYLVFALRFYNNTPWYPLSVTLVAAYIFFGLYFLFEDAFFIYPRNLLRSVSVTRLALFATVIVLFSLGRMLATAKAGANEPHAHFYASTLAMLIAYVEGTCIPLSTRFPAEFAVGHILYFGPLLLLTACFPRQAARAAGQFGFGFLLLVAVSWLHAIMPLSRQWIAGYPVVALATVMALESVPLSRGFFACFAVLSLFVSKAWLRFNVQPDPTATGSTFDGALAWIPGFFFNNYISSTGRWMSAEWYAVQAAALLAAFLFYYWYFYAPRASLSQAWSGKDPLNDPRWLEGPPRL